MRCFSLGVLVGVTGWYGDLKRLAQALLHPSWYARVGMGGRPLVVGNVPPKLGAQAGLEDFLAWMRGYFDARG